VGGRKPLDIILIISFIILVFEFALLVNSSIMLNYNSNNEGPEKSIMPMVKTTDLNEQTSNDSTPISLDNEDCDYGNYDKYAVSDDNSNRYTNNNNNRSNFDGNGDNNKCKLKINILNEFDMNSNETYGHLPKNYYEISDKLHPDVKHKDINTLYHILLKIKLPPYTKNYDCSEASAQLEWILEGYGFKTYLATSPYPPPGSNGTKGHMWVIVKLDDGESVAVESTLLTKNNYHPPGIIVGEHEKYLNYSYIYHDYITYLKKYSYKNYYVLPKNFTDFMENYYVPPITEWRLELMAHYYYNPPILCDSPEDYISGIKRGNKIYYIPITQFDWWNNPDNKYINN
jgi:hypothetical protein